MDDIIEEKLEIDETIENDLNNSNNKEEDEEDNDNDDDNDDDGNDDDDDDDIYKESGEDKMSKDNLIVSCNEREEMTECNNQSSDNDTTGDIDDDDDDDGGHIFTEIDINMSLEDMLEMERTKESTLVNMKRIKQEKRYTYLTKMLEINQMKWKKLKEETVSVEKVNSGEDQNDKKMIQERMKEIKSMCSYYSRPDYILYMLQPNVRQYALTLINVDKDNFKKQFRSTWTLYNHFQYHGRMAHSVSALAKSHLKYSNWTEDNDSGSASSGNKATSNATGRPAQVGGSTPSNIYKYSINKVIRLQLIMNPRFRTNSHLQQIIWFNRTSGAFSDVFPQQMESEVARCIGYEVYDDNRIIRCQGQLPQKLYYLLSGKFEYYKLYSLTQGRIHKSFGFVGPRQMTNFQEFDNGSLSEYYIVAKGVVEVLTIHREDYLRMTSRMDISTLRRCLDKIGILRNVEITNQILRNQIVRMDYFKHGRIICAEPYKSQYIYVVKSGSAIVVRLQQLEDTNEFQSRLLHRSSVSRIGCHRDNTHASAMLGLSSRQKTFKQFINTTKLPPLQKPHTCVNLIVTNDNSTINDSDPSNDDDTTYNATVRKTQTSLALTQPTPLVGLGSSNSHINMAKKTLVDRDSDTYYHNPVHQSQHIRYSYVILDQLNPLDVFGLETIEEISNEKPQKLVLISEGAEIIMISKRHLMKAVTNNTLLQIKQLTKTYLSEEDANRTINTEVKWRTYKQVLMKGMVNLHC